MCGLSSHVSAQGQILRVPEQPNVLQTADGAALQFWRVEGQEQGPEGQEWRPEGQGQGPEGQEWGPEGQEQGLAQLVLPNCSEKHPVDFLGQRRGEEGDHRAYKNIILLMNSHGACGIIEILLIKS